MPDQVGEKSCYGDNLNVAHGLDTFKVVNCVNGLLDKVGRVMCRERKESSWPMPIYSDGTTNNDPRCKEKCLYWY
jgi:hypothetical protein